MNRHLTLVLCGLCLALAMLPTAASASGGSSIASAPTLAYGQVAAGGGLQQEFWHLQLYSGDKLTFLADLGSNPEYGTREYGFTLYSPSVSDYNLRDATASAEVAPSSGKNEFVLKSPFSGAGTLDICEGVVESTRPCGQLGVDVVTLLTGQADPYSFTATVTHATSLEVSAPTLAQSGSRVTIRASVQSPAGTPEGSCLVQKHLVPLVGGRCALRLRLGHTGKQKIGVAFVPNDGWQAASGHRTVRLLP
jgi:hypothetical protein